MARSVMGRGAKNPKAKMGKAFNTGKQGSIPFHCPCNGQLKKMPVQAGSKRGNKNG